MDNATLNQFAAAKQANAGLMREGFKCNTLFSLFDNCADRCRLIYAESGLKDESVEGVTCFKNCISKEYKLANQKDMSQ